ncbi:MAG: HEAT repeat domain-containing protein [Acidobacteriota bacterium]|jgi:HEAT repeat protein
MGVIILFLSLFSWAHAGAAAEPGVVQQSRIKDLKSNDLGVRRLAAKEMASAPMIPAEAIPALLQSIADSDDVVGLQSAIALVNAGTRALPELDRALQSPDGQVRKRTAEAFSRAALIDPKVWPILIGAFRDTNIDVRWYSAHALGHQGAAALPLLVPTLKDADPRLRRGAGEALEYMGSAARPAVPDLLRILQDPDLSVQLQGALALAAIDPGQAKAVPILIKAASGSFAENDETSRAIFSLGSFGRLAEPAIPLLLNLLSGAQRASTRSIAAGVLGKIQALSDSELETMARALKDSDRSVRAAVARALGMLAPDTPAAIPFLLQAFHDSEGGVRMTSADALGKFGAAAAPGLAQASQDDDIYVRQAVVESFRAMKTLPSGATEILTRMVDDSNTEVREGAAYLLRQAGIQGDWEARFKQMEQGHNVTGAAKGTEVEQNRLYSKEEIIASIPADADHKYPLELEYLIPFSGNNGVQLPVTLHRGKDRGDLLVIWRQVGEKYQKLVSMEADGPGLDWFGKAKSFRFNDDFFIQIPQAFTGTGGVVKQTIFAVPPFNALAPVQIQQADEWYKDKLKAGETIENGSSFTASDNKLEFMFGIWNSGDAHCCPTAGLVRGTYKITKSDPTFDPQTKTLINKFVMSVATATREPIPKR